MSMVDAAAKVCSVMLSDECGVSDDGTWQRHGHSSLNGFVSVISVDTGKVIDMRYFPVSPTLSKPKTS